MFIFIPDTVAELLVIFTSPPDGTRRDVFTPTALKGLYILTVPELTRFVTLNGIKPT